MKVLRALPCRTPGCGGHQQMPGVAVLRDGSPYLIGRAPDFPYLVACAKCKRKTRVTQFEWNQLQAVTQEQIDAVKLDADDQTHKDFKALTKSVVES